MKQKTSHAFKLHKSSKSTFVNPFNALNDDRPRDSALIPTMASLGPVYKKSEPVKPEISMSTCKRDAKPAKITQKFDEKYSSQRKNKTYKKKNSSLVTKYKPNASCLYTPIRRSGRNNSMSGVKRSS